MKIGHKLTIGYFSIAVLIAAAGFLSTHISQKALKQSIGEGSNTLAQQILDSIDHTFSDYIESFMFYAKRTDLRDAVKQSNEHFAQMKDRDSYIKQQDALWTSGKNEKHILPFINQLCNNDLARDLKRLTAFHQNLRGYPVFPEIFVVNRYGVIVAETSRTTDYYQADEITFQSTRKQKDYWVGDVAYDESTRTYSSNIAVNIYDEHNQFAGMIIAAWNIEEVIEIIRHAQQQVARENQTPPHFVLLDSKNRQIYATSKPKSLEQLPASVLALIDTYQGHSYFIAQTEDPPGENLVSHAHSQGHHNFTGMDWTLCIARNTSDIFASVTRLKDITLITILVAVLITIVLGNLFTRLITRPVSQLIEATRQLGQGKLNISENIKSIQEFNALADELQNKNEHLNQQIAERKEAQKELVQVAFHDKLTGLANRALFLDRLEQLIHKSKRKKNYLFALLYLDLDRFKTINDSLGHAQGDTLLVEVAHRLKSSVRAIDTVARLGGDEFTILLDEIHNFGDATDVAERVNQVLQQPIILADEQMFITASIGIVVSATDNVSSQELLRNADTAMCRAKELGSGTYQIFDVSLQQKVRQRVELEQALRQALNDEQYVLFYQPIINLNNGKLKGFEALIRWNHPTRGLVPPAEFIGLCEETGLIVQLSQWVLRSACRQTRQWQKQFPHHADLSISVNLSAKQLMQSDIIDQIHESLIETGLDPACLNLEITESLLMAEPEVAKSILHQMKETGIRLDIDDFGTGYSSLSYLHQFPFDTLKVDRSFVNQMIDDPTCANIVRSIILLAQNLNLTINAEGIETLRQLHSLRQLGCHLGQGFFFSKPLCQKEAQEFLQRPMNWLDKIVSAEQYCV